MKQHIGMRHLNNDTKVYKNCIRLINLLMDGDFGCCNLDEDYMSDYGIKTKDLINKWSEEELKEAIDRFDYMCSDIHIADKSYYPKNMSEFLYNPRTNKSFIMSLLGEWREVPGRPIKELYPRACAIYQNMFWSGTEFNLEQYNIFTRNVNYVVRQQMAFEEVIGKWYYYHMLKGFNFYLCHCNYIKQNYQDRDDFNINHIGPMTFDGCVAWLHEVYGVTLHPTSDEIERAKEQYDSDTETMRKNVEYQDKILLNRIEWLKTRRYRDRVGQDMANESELNTCVPVASDTKL